MILITENLFRLMTKIINEKGKNRNEGIKEGVQSGGEQDGHHDEGHQLSKQTSFVKQLELGRLQNVLSGARVCVPDDQDKKLQLGNGVILRFSDEKVFFVLDGYSLTEDFVSTAAPLGQVIIGAESGQTKEYSAGTKKISVTIEKIFGPFSEEVTRVYQSLD